MTIRCIVAYVYAYLWLSVSNNVTKLFAPTCSLLPSNTFPFSSYVISTVHFPSLPLYIHFLLPTPTALPYYSHFFPTLNLLLLQNLSLLFILLYFINGFFQLLQRGLSIKSKFFFCTEMLLFFPPSFWDLLRLWSWYLSLWRLASLAIFIKHYCLLLLPSHRQYL